MSGRSYEFEGNTVAEHGGREEDGVGKHGGGLGDLLGTGPLFQVVRRGYDQLAVDAYVQSAEEELRTLRGRLHTVHVRYRACADALVVARRRPEDRAAEIIADARAEAEARIGNVTALREAAMAARDEARRERELAAAELQAAREEAQELLAEAHAAREQAEATATLRLAALESEMEDLRVQRDEARAYLRRLTGQIERALQSLTAVLPDDARMLAPVPEPGSEVLAG
jgi:colicin import membrane protein